ncbi:MAG: hypoxanthine phosphoribosyltransferase [Rhodospirillaceae bacterium]|nr:MAG: hypoxanthine phosphoribosyltransferase [Rhodospirillaceae bacterium]
MEKVFITANQLLDDSFRLGHQILADGFKPDYIVGIWRGGAPIGIAVQELLASKGVDTDHISIRTSSYTGIGQQNKEVRVHGLHYIIENANADDSLLIVDDTFDSGRSVGAVIDTIRDLSRANTPSVIKVATVYYKPTLRKVDFVPDYYIHETDKWLVFPHEIQGLSEAEIKEHKPVVL